MFLAFQISNYTYFFLNEEIIDMCLHKAWVLRCFLLNKFLCITSTVHFRTRVGISNKLIFLLEQYGHHGLKTCQIKESKYFLLVQNDWHAILKLWIVELTTAKGLLKTANGLLKISPSMLKSQQSWKYPLLMLQHNYRYLY